MIEVEVEGEVEQQLKALLNAEKYEQFQNE